MDQFSLYVRLGLEHILDVRGYDHILFVVALAAVYQFRDWKKIIVLVTAFTVGHSVTLALATLKLVSIAPQWVEFIIPVTILITAVSNLMVKADTFTGKGIAINYWYACGFGLIHGLGFSNYLQALLGSTQSIFIPLLAFNIGLEIGQIIIVVLFLLVSLLVTHVLKIQAVVWKVVVSIVIIVLTLTLFKDRIFWM